MKKYTLQISMITIIQTMFMGMIDAYTFSSFNGSFASAQTGNLIIFGVELVRSGFQKASAHIPIFIGFLLGAIFAQHLKNKFTQRRTAKSIQLKWFIAISILISTSLYVNEMYFPKSTFILLPLLGFFASYELTMFNSIGNTNVNNGIMTGNIKNVGNLTASFLKNPNRETAQIIINHTINIVIFMIGILVSTIYFNQEATTTLLSGTILNSAMLVYLLSDQATIQNQETIQE